MGKKCSAQAYGGLDATSEWHLQGLGYHRELSWQNRGPVYKSSIRVSSTKRLHSAAENLCPLRVGTPEACSEVAMGTGQKMSSSEEVPSPLMAEDLGARPAKAA